MISYMLYLAILTTTGEIHAAPVQSFGTVAECHRVGAYAAEQIVKTNSVTVARYYCVESTAT